MAKSPPDQSQINALEAEILEIYNQAYKELLEKEKKYLAKIQPKWDQADQLLKSGAISQTEHDTIQANLLKSNPWTEAKKHAADIISKSNEVATAIVNESALGYFTYNANYENYSLENGAGVSFGFGIYDRSTITRLLKDNPDLLPQKKLDPAKDVPWNMKKINTALQQGIIQGESLFQIAKRIADVTSSSNKAAMIRAARTAMTGAQNGGRVASMLEAEKMGLKIQKKWMSTLDNRTRDTHRHLDGQSVPLSEKFKVDGEEIEFPGDPHAAPGLVWNCRCTLVDDFIDFPSTYNRYDNIDGKPIAGMTYDEWAKAKASGADMAPKAPTWSVSPDLQKPWLQQQNKDTSDNVSIEEISISNKELTPIERIKDIIAKHEGSWDLDEIQDIGRQFSDEVKKNYEEVKAQNDIQLRELLKEMHNAQQEVIAQTKRNSELNRMINETDDKSLKKQYRKELTDGRSRRKELENQRDELTKKYWKFVEDSTSWRSTLKKALAQIRDIGGVTEDNVVLYADLQEYPYPTGKTKAATIEAMNHYPSSWLKLSKNNDTKLYPHWTTDRAYYNPSTGEIRFNERISTNIHELGHRFEQAVPGILRSEREFYARRTAGEPLEWLGSPYRKDEVARKDNFINPYMGKDYHGTAFELVSMGFEYAYTDHEKLAQDPDMETWIYGLLAVM